MAVFRRKYNTLLVAGTTAIRIPIVKRGVVDFAVSADWTPAAIDCRIAVDNTSPAALTNLPTATTSSNTAFWEFILTAAELSCKQAVITVSDSATKAIEDTMFIVETFGNASAMWQADISLPNLPANVTQLLGTAWLTPGTAGTPDVNTKLIGGTSQTGRDLGTSVLLSSGTGTGQISLSSGTVTTGAISNGAINSNTFSAGAITNATFSADSMLQAIRANLTQSGSTSSTVKLDASASGTADFYKGAVIRVSGAVPGQTRLITGYNETNKVATITPNWATTPTAGDDYVIMPYGSADVTAIRGSSAVGAAGYVGVDWANIAAPTTSVNLSGTTISTSQAITSVSGAVGSVTGAVGSVTSRVTANTDQLAGQTVTAASGVTFPSSVASPTNITAATGIVLAGVTHTGAVIPLVTTTTTVTGQLTGAEIATAIWQDSIGTDFTTASSIGKALYTGNFVPGAAGGLFIAGTNAATTITGTLTTSLTGSVGSIASGGITTGSFAAGAINAAAIANGAIDNAALAADTGLQAIRSASAQATGNSTTTIKLDASASGTVDYYKGATIYLTGGTGAGQARVITAYDETTKIATVTPAWIAPDVTTTFSILPHGPSDIVSIKGTASAGSAGYVGVDWGNVTAQSTSVNLSGTTIATVTNQLSAQQIATGVWTDSTGSDFTTASSIGKALYTGNFVPGAAGGLFIAGTNAATTITTGLTTTFTGNLTGSVGSVATGGITAASFAADAISSAAVSAAAVAKIWAQAMTELSAVPGVTADALSALSFIFETVRNKITQTATTQLVYKDDGTTVLATSTVSDDGTTFTRGEFS